MGKLSDESILSGVRGKTGGLVVSSNATGGYVRPWFMPRVPRTPEQTAWVAKWNGWVQQWKTLDSGGMAAWSTASEDSVWTRTDWFGQAYQPTGFNLWLIVQSMRDSVGLGVTNTPPSPVPPAGVISCVMQYPGWSSTSFPAVYFSPAGASGVAYAQVEFAPFNGPYGARQNKPFRPLWAGAYEAGSWIDVSAKVAAVVGRLYAWSGVWYRWRGLSSQCVPNAWQTGSTHTGA